MYGDADGHASEAAEGNDPALRLGGPGDAVDHGDDRSDAACDQQA
jgi:hypothetical protein